MRGFQWLDQEEVPRLLPTRLAYVGLRDLDPGEKAFIRALGIKAYTMHEVDRHGIGKVGAWVWMNRYRPSRAVASFKTPTAEASIAIPPSTT